MSPERPPLMTRAQQFQLHVGGGWRDGSGEARDVLSPATAEVLCTVTDASPADVDMACSVAGDAFPAWAATDSAERARLLRRLGEIIGERMDELAALESAVTGRPIREMRAQMSRIPEWLDYFAGIILGLEGEANGVKGGFLTYTHYRPYGVCALLTPWNHPVLILVKKMAAALAAGNVLVTKPSELAPVSPLILAQWAHEAGFPDGVVNVVTGGAETGAALVGNPLVARIDLTGGTATGKQVAAAAAERLVPCTLELGGKTPVIVFEDADLNEAVPGSLFAAFVAAGQTCVSGSRFLVQQSIYDRFVERFAGRVKSLRVGDPSAMGTDVGPVISARSRDRCFDFIRDAEASGARLAAGGSLPDLSTDMERGFFVPPTVFADVHPQMRLFREEVFGPVVSITPFADEAEALSLANDSEFALGASVWCRDILRAHRVARQARAGVTWINDHHKNDPRSIWGGYGASGYGKENGWDALKSYLIKGSVIVRTQEGFADWFAGGDRYG
ncbi:MAG: aldehyde dehydrogenase family protein [Alphaproteobacteria bacterium]|nr:aldehyde dehydrogenase family protein [Alphaproteobacteria bacterium]MBU0803924.1 aldehyde dehydrogenase family protein [Alphaproteobacteria bacterium]MBU0872779.1 aldehyde dehydrogenase family protein [Alphaproteobacteria bacterium]MBU1402851.1 aldehyde dehydrogenase family protein [Alphaproteobacteria bacterium]MBU1593493.1 aldehyde dehydrogenase family protein [Alphaproteobacteria bacterium]